MKKKQNYIEKVINELLDKNEIPFDDAKEQLDIDEQMKMQILKLICYNNKKLSIKNLYLSNYPDILKNSAILFLQKLAKLKGFYITYDPENYEQIKKNKLFQIFLSLTKKELLPLFLMIGFYSYINLRKNNIDKIIQFQSNDYFEKYNNLYINIKNRSLPQIINLYIKKIQGELEFADDDDKENPKLTKEEFKIVFNSYISYHELYIKGDLFSLIDSLFSSVTPNFNSVLLRKGNEYITINSLIETLLEQIYESIKSGFYDDNEIRYLIDTLYDSFKEYLGYSNQINYIKFVDIYCTKFRKEKTDPKLYLICSFFRGLNPLVFEDVFKNIDFCLGKDHFNNIEKYYKQMKTESDSDKIIESCEEINNLNSIKENISYESSDEKKSESPENEIKKIGELIYLDEKQNTEIVKKPIDSDETSTNEECKLKNDKNDISFKSNNDENNEYIENINNEANELNSENLFETIQFLKNKIIKIEKQLKESDNKYKESQKQYKESQKKYKESQKKYKESQKQYKEYQNKYEVSQKKYEESQKNYEVSQKNYEESKKLFINKIKKQNKEIEELKSEMKSIKFRDVSKLIINKYVNKYSKVLPQSYNNKKDQVYGIAELLKGKEKLYFQQLIDKYYHSNDESHFTGLLAEYKNIETNGPSNNTITQNMIKNYIIHIFGIEEKETYKKKKEYLVKLFGLESVISYLFINKNIYK